MCDMTLVLAATVVGLVVHLAEAGYYGPKTAADLLIECGYDRTGSPTGHGPSGVCGDYIRERVGFVNLRSNVAVRVDPHTAGLVCAAHLTGMSDEELAGLFAGWALPEVRGSAGVQLVDIVIDRGLSKTYGCRRREAPGRTP